MRSLRALPVGSAVAQLGLLGTLDRAAHVGAAGVGTGFGCALLGGALLARALTGRRPHRLGPGDHVTVTRATLACVVASLTAQSLLGQAHLPGHELPTVLVVIAGVALVLDAVDGWVARQTGTATPLGARMDMEVDAFLILVLSVAASMVLGWWVLAIGVFRYAFMVATWVAPWLSGAVPPRYSRKAVAALQGIVLTVVTAQLVPREVSGPVVVVALTLLAWSFGTQAAELWPARRQRVGRHGITGGAIASLARPVGPETGSQPARVLE